MRYRSFCFITKRSKICLLLLSVGSALVFGSAGIFGFWVGGFEIGGVVGAFGEGVEIGGAFGEGFELGGAFGEGFEIGGAFGEGFELGGAFGEGFEIGGAIGEGFEFCPFVYGLTFWRKKGL